MIGAGMTLTGACPGTVLVQVATGIKSGTLTALGALLGGVLYANFGDALKKPSSTAKTAPGAQAHTVQTKLNMDLNRVLLAYEIMCVAIITIATAFGLDPSGGLLNPIVGGLLIGGAQAASLFFTGNAIGVSSAYEEAGRWFWHLLGRDKQGGQPSTRSMTFALGILVGSFAFSTILPNTGHTADISGVRALLGGAIMVFG